MFRQKYFILILSVFGIIFCSISLVNHYNFRTYAWDLGISNNALFDYAHFRWNDCMLLQPQYKNVLGDHFSLLPILISPLYWIFSSYTLLVFQIASILFGGIGIYKYFQFKFSNAQLSLLAMAHFFSIWGIYSALATDYHDNVVAAMFVPWFILFFDKKEWKKSILFFTLICISKENMALWTVFISLALTLANIKDRSKVQASLSFMAIAVIYFFVIIQAVIPSLSNTPEGYHHFNFAALGQNPKECFSALFTRPEYVFTLLFENHTAYPLGYGIKSELHFMVLLSGGLAFFYKPQYLVMLIPIYAQKLFNDDMTKWGLNNQYSIEFVPVLTIALFSFIGSLKNQHKIKIAIACLLISLSATISSMDKRVSYWYQTETQRFYQKAHYVPSYDVNKTYEALKLIPGNASVSASSCLVPHLAFRDYIYQFPEGEDVDYIVLLEGENFYPLSKPEFILKVDSLKHSPLYSMLYDNYKMFIFKKN